MLTTTATSYVLEVPVAGEDKKARSAHFFRLKLFGTCHPPLFGFYTYLCNARRASSEMGFHGKAWTENTGPYLPGFQNCSDLSDWSTSGRCDDSIDQLFVDRLFQSTPSKTSEVPTRRTHINIDTRLFTNLGVLTPRNIQLQQSIFLRVPGEPTIPVRLVNGFHRSIETWVVQIPRGLLVLQFSPGNVFSVGALSCLTVFFSKELGSFKAPRALVSARFGSVNISRIASSFSSTSV